MLKQALYPPELLRMIIPGSKRVCVQAQDELSKRKIEATELAQKLAEDVAITEELQEELSALEAKFNAVQKERSGTSTLYCFLFNQSWLLPSPRSVADVDVCIAQTHACCYKLAHTDQPH